MSKYKFKLNFLIIKNILLISYIGENMTKAEIYSKILDISEKSYYRWKSKDHKTLITLIEKYFLDEELEEFLNTGRIQRFEIAQTNNYLSDKSIKIYKILNSILPTDAKKIFFNELKKLKSYKIDDISHIIFYSLSDQDLDSQNTYINGISKISIRLHIYKLFEKIDEFEIEYFIKNIDEIILKSRNLNSKSNILQIISLGVYGIEKINISEFEENFFKIYNDNLIKINKIEILDENKIFILIDIISPLSNKKFTKDNFKVIESDKELNLNLDEYKLFSKLITNFLKIKFF